VLVSATFDKIRPLVQAGDWRASDHGLQRLGEHSIIASDLVDGIAGGMVVEDYPDYHAGPCVLLLQKDRDGPVHVLWGLEKGTDRPAVLITAYRPDPERWEDDYRTRKS
jgi:hypothetical protein